MKDDTDITVWVRPTTRLGTTYADRPRVEGYAIALSPILTIDMIDLRIGGSAATDADVVTVAENIIARLSEIRDKAAARIAGVPEMVAA